MPDSATELIDQPAAETDPPAAAIADPRTEIADTRPDDVVAADLLVEEISIDGMCGVY